MNGIVCLQKYKTTVSTSTVISGSAKCVTYLLLKIGFCFLPNLCSLMGRMKLVMYSRQVIEVAWFHMGWRKLSVEWVAMPFSRRSSWQGLKPHLLGLLLCQEGSRATWEVPGTACTTSVFLVRFLGWNVRFVLLRSPLLRCLFLPFLPQSGAVECRRMSCPPLNCSPDSLPVHIAGECCKVCRRKYWLRVRVALSASRLIYSLFFQTPNWATLMKYQY